MTLIFPYIYNIVIWESILSIFRRFWTAYIGHENKDDALFFFLVYVQTTLNMEAFPRQHRLPHLDVQVKIFQFKWTFVEVK